MPWGNCATIDFELGVIPAKAGIHGLTPKLNREVWPWTPDQIGSDIFRIAKRSK
jgi:hypothetical protein